MIAKSKIKAVMCATLLSGAMLFNATAFAATPSKPITSSQATKPMSSSSASKSAPVNSACKQAHPDVYSQSYKDCAKKAAGSVKK